MLLCHQVRRLSKPHFNIKSRKRNAQLARTMPRLSRYAGGFLQQVGKLRAPLFVFTHRDQNSQYTSIIGGIFRMGYATKKKKLRRGDLQCEFLRQRATQPTMTNKRHGGMIRLMDLQKECGNPKGLADVVKDTHVRSFVQVTDIALADTS